MTEAISAPTNALAQRGILLRSQLAAEFNITNETMVAWEKNGMPSIREGNTVLYSVDHVIKWLHRGKRVKAKPRGR